MMSQVARGESRKARVALVGAGTIAHQYVEGLRHTPGFEVTGVCARSALTTQDFAESHGLVPMNFDQLLGDQSIDYVLNLTPAHEHGTISKQILEARKSVYSEKPLAATLEEADELIALASERHLLLACAPATFLWPPLTTARKLIAQDQLGKVVGAFTSLVYPGPELFHPHPEHLYMATAGPLRDMGIYQVTALMALLGPIVSVSAMASRAFDRRTVLVGPAAGVNFPVGAQTHVHALLSHAGGAISTVIVSFDAHGAGVPRFEVFGQKAALSINNMHLPNAMVELRTLGEIELIETDQVEISPAVLSIGPTSAWRDYMRGVEPETSACRMRGVLEVLLAIEHAFAQGTVVDIYLG
jgi:predicted dehydrogenase